MFAYQLGPVSRKLSSLLGSHRNCDFPLQITVSKMSSGFMEWRVTKKATKKEAFAGVTVKVEAGVEPEDAVGVGVEVNGDVASEAVQEEDAVGATADEDAAVGVVGADVVEEEAQEEAVAVEVELAPQPDDEEEEAWGSMAWDTEIVRKYKRRRVSNFVVTRSSYTPKAAKQRKKLAGYNADGRACASALKRLAPYNMGG